MLYEIYHRRGNVREVYKYMGVEPSGTYFNAPVFDKHNRPHNPMVNAGAIILWATSRPSFDCMLKRRT